MTGFGRTGKKWGLDHWDTVPDIIATAKGLSGGYMPLGATIASDKVFEGFGEPFAHGHTYGSHPVACAAGVAVLDYMNKHNLVERSRVNGEYLHKKLESFYDHPSVGDIRGRKPCSTNASWTSALITGYYSTLDRALLTGLGATI
jgi:adenosylmethionine-8-amino-7-oxononanoate aminotransferase